MLYAFTNVQMGILCKVYPVAIIAATTTTTTLLTLKPKLCYVP